MVPAGPGAASRGLLPHRHRRLRQAGKTKGLYTRTVSVPVSAKVTVKVYHCANGDGSFDGQIELRTYSLHQCKFDGVCDGDGDGDGTVSHTITLCYHSSLLTSDKHN